MTGHRPFAKILQLRPDDVTTDELRVACTTYCREIWGSEDSEPAVLMVLQALDLAGFKVVRR